MKKELCHESDRKYGLSFKNNVIFFVNHCLTILAILRGYRSGALVKNR